MQTKRKMILRHYKRILRELDALSHYVEIHRDNFYVFSVNNANLLTEVCRYIDSIDSLLPHDYDRAERDSTASKLFKKALRQGLDFSKMRTSINGVEISPWAGSYEKENKIFKFPWWKAHTDLKHEYYEHHKKATLENLLNSIGAFQILLMFIFSGAGGGTGGYAKLFEENDLVQSFVENDNVNIYFHTPEASIDQLIWCKLREQPEKIREEEIRPKLRK